MYNKKTVVFGVLLDTFLQIDGMTDWAL